MDYENARAERDFRQNPPSNAPGQDDINDWDSMAVGSSSAESVSDSYSSDINSTLSLNNGISSNLNGVQVAQGGAQQQTQPKSTEDRIFDLLEYSGKGVFSYLKALIESFRNNTSTDWHYLGGRTCIISTVVIVLGGLGCIWELFAQNGNDPILMVVGGLISMIVGVALLMFFDVEKKDESILDEVVVEDDTFPDMPEYDDFDNGIEEEVYDDSYVDEEYVEEETDDSVWDDYLSGDDEVYESEVGIDSPDFDSSEIIDSLTNITPGTQTRQYLFEAYMKVLPIITPDYSDMVEISSDDNEFYDFEDMLRSAASQVGMKDDNLPELLSVGENPFIYRLTCTRPTGMKEKQIADEIANTFSRDNYNRLVRYGVYANVDTSVGVCSINLFKGFEKDAMGNQVGGVIISLGDVYNKIRDFVCSPSIEFPFVWGIDALGETLYCDMKDNNSVIISGEPRGGKSWKGQSFVAQLCMFHSPRDIELYFLDNKDKASDYRYLSQKLPHVRYFCGDRDKINDSLEAIINRALNVNGEKMAAEGFINIKDYNKAHPENPLPYMYVFIDELQALMDYFEDSGQKDEQTRFRSYLSTMTSKLPYTGLRFVLFPHRIVNQIISKNAYSLISCRAVVNQLDSKEVENAIGASESKFGYKLAQKGDMGIRLHELNGGEACYCHAEVLTSSNKGNEKLFEYIGGVWRKLEPDFECIEINGQIGGRVDTGKKSSSIGSSSSKGVSLKKARDNTEGIDSYTYTGNGSGDFTQGSGFADLSSEGFDDEDGDTDESFWEDLMNTEE